jgi:2-polyprenyl-3-methyl-5-hydroxy-6-metoxy-1,4-benzoquinol methylase
MVRCGACAGAVFGPFFRAHEASVSGVYLAEPVIPTEGATIELEYCKTCGLIRQVPGQTIRLNYDRIERGTAQQLPTYSADILSTLSALGVQPDDFILEVGANDGTFLRELRSRGHRNLLGIEPSKQLAETSRKSGLDVRDTYFDRRLAAEIRAARGPARAVICRHTLEHVPDIFELVKGIAEVLSEDGLSLIEVPDTDWVVTNLFAHEIWDEHISYFRPCSLAKLVENCRLRPIRLERIRFRDTRNLLCWSTPVSTQVSAPSCIVEDEAGFESLERFQERWDAFSTRLRSLVNASPKPILGIGAAHIQLNFLNFTGLGASVDALIDDDKSKTGRFAPLTKPVPIRSTAEILATMRSGTLLRTAFPYPDWEDRIEEALRIYGVRCIKPYDILQSLQ